MLIKLFCEKCGAEIALHHFKGRVECDGNLYRVVSDREPVETYSDPHDPDKEFLVCPGCGKWYLVEEGSLCGRK